MRAKDSSFAAKITSDDCEIGDDGALCRVDRESFVIGENSRGPRELVKACWGYAITCHKSQGSEWPRVVIIDDGWRGNGTEDRKKWIYTAITRASQKLIIAE